ncbi:hypothetical protein N0V82_005975 [Gnomoniopsis sp. IMI 355080]|nr:hypothetical protein N0V82_005975 [Gnomoniopsis sp. IMI 355080]
MADRSSNPESSALPLDGSSTNPNTPRSPTPGEPATADDEPVEAHSSPKSTTSGEHTGDIRPTWPKSIDVTKVNAVTSWGDHRLPHLFLDLHWNPNAHKAFFKLRATVTLRNGTSRRDGRTSMYLYIYPERIRQLSVDVNPAEQMLGVETLQLKFELNRSPDLVLPKSPCEPKNKTASDVMDALRALARQTCFSVYASIPRKRLSVKRIRDLCIAATDCGLASLAVHASTASLYHGKGGQVVEGESLADPADDAPPAIDEPPPRYTEPPPADPSSAVVSDSKGKKRRRTHSTSPEPTSEPASLKVIQELLDLRLSSLKQDFDERLAAHKKDVAEMLDKTETRLLEVLRRDMEQRCDGVQELLEHRVHEEMAEVEENVMRNLSEAPLSATLTFPSHPWY